MRISKPAKGKTVESKPAGPGRPRIAPEDYKIQRTIRLTAQQWEELDFRTMEALRKWLTKPWLRRG